jgi:mannose-1-phosphate guanylyltransferase
VLADLWTIVLAGGAGQRLNALTGGVPKQFWVFRDGPTLVEETVRRIAPLSPAERRVTVVDASHAPYVEGLRYRRALGSVIRQPADRGTAAGVMLGLTEVLASDPRALVLITPADHGVAHVDEFQRGILSAAAFVGAGRSDVVLFGVEPTGPTADYGWISPRPNGGSPVGHFTAVVGFVEKPAAEDAKRLYLAGAVWNTMVLVGRAAAVFAECQRHLPAMAGVFAEARRHAEPDRTRLLDACYRAMPSADFSRDVLAPARRLGLFTWSGRMGWSDLGTPDRMRAWRSGLMKPSARAHRRAAAVPLPGVA